VSSILIVTALYPESANISRLDQTYAIHNLVKYWKNDILIVVKPVRVRIRNLAKWPRLCSSDIDGIHVLAIPFFQIPFFDKPFLFFFLLSLKRTLKYFKFMPEVIISHYDLSHIIASKVKKYFDIPHVAVVHFTDLKRILEKKSIGKKIRRALFYSDRICFRSAQLKKRFVELMGDKVNGRTMSIIASGIEKTEILSRERFHEKITDRNFQIITVASLKKRKNISNVIDALATMRDLPWTYQIIGNGSECAKLESHIHAYDLTDRISLTGLLDHAEVMRRMESSEIFILPSEGETFGLVYLEAMAKGCVVIALKNDGVDGVIIDGINGFLCDTSSKQDISTALRRVFSVDNRKLSELLDATYNTICAYSETDRSSIYRSVIQDVMNKVENNNDNNK